MAKGQPVSTENLEVARAIEHRVRAAGTSFYWAMRLQPEEKRRALFAVYAFCREVDDIADSTAPVKTKVSRLRKWRTAIASLYQGKADNLTARALLPAVRGYKLERAAFLAIIDGMEMDATGPIRAPSWKTLDLYCARVACAVGLLCIRIFGEPGKSGKETADALGRALQLTNILRDLREDAGWGRLYLPKELLEKHGITDTDPEKILENPKLDAACRDLAKEAEKEFARAEAAIARCDQSAIRPAVMMKDVYKRTLARLKRRGFTPGAVAKGEGAVGKAARKLEKFLVALKSLA